MKIGIDIGGTKTQAVILDTENTVLHSVRLPTGYGPEEVAATARDVVLELARMTQIRVEDVRSIGIGIPGKVNPERGLVEHSVNLGLQDWDATEAFRRTIGTTLPIRLENDVNAAALGAFALTDASNSMTYLNVGTGLAAGVILDGKIYAGSAGVAGEIGHIPVDPDGVLCGCGQRGCLETICSGSGIARQWAELSDAPVHTMADAAAEGNPDALRIRDTLFEGLATAVSFLALTIDTQTVVLGGGVTVLGEPLLEGVRQMLRRRAEGSAFLTSLELDTRVQLLAHSLPVASYGAALIGEANHG